MLNKKLTFFLFSLFFISTTLSYAKSHYEVLGITVQATPEEIKLAYRRLAMKWHPDRNSDPQAGEKFKEIKSAYDSLTNPKSTTSSYSYGSESDWAPKYKDTNDFAEQNSNSKWRYHRETQSFYDNRIRKWVRLDNRGNFRTEEGWLFYPENGSYLNTDIGAEWNPSDEKGWHRNVSNFNDKYISIDIRTGFALSVKYQPNTVSDMSDVFDMIFNPINLMEFKYYSRGNRAELLEKQSSNNWTEEQKLDFIERARAHTKIFFHKDMRPRFTTQGAYADALMETIIDNPKSKEYSEVITEFIRGMEFNDLETFVKEFATTENWYSHSNASKWMRELFRTNDGAKIYFSTVFVRNKDLPTALREVRRFYADFLEVGMKPNAIDTIIRYLNFKFHLEGFVAFSKEIDHLIRTPQFSEMIATYTTQSRDTQEMINFLNWYEKKNPEVARVFLTALSMPGADRNDFYRVTPDGSENRFHEDEYNSAKKSTTQARLNYINQHLSQFAKTQVKSNLTCGSLFH